MVGSHEALVPEAVYEEAVVRGKRELYEDAFELERLLEDEGSRSFDQAPSRRRTGCLKA